MDKDTKDILEAINFIKDHMVTKTDFDDAVEKLDDLLAAVESANWRHSQSHRR